jgi:hypothetical protein
MATFSVPVAVLIQPLSCTPLVISMFNLFSTGSYGARGMATFSVHVAVLIQPLSCTPLVISMFNYNWISDWYLLLNEKEQRLVGSESE